MKHHFADLLDRDGTYWTIVPNIKRYSYSLDQKIVNTTEARIVTISSDDEHWKQIFELPRLEELTLHEASKEQIEAISSLTHLKRLRITHARLKNIDFVAGLENLEECVFEYVSGFSDLSPFAQLSKLKSLHFENLRRVSDFGGLSGMTGLKYLYITGTLDWNQPIENFGFLRNLPSLEVLHLGWITNKADYPALKALTDLKNLKRIEISRDHFSTAEYAFLELALPHVEGATSDLFWEYMDRIEFLGKRAGWAGANSPKAKEKCQAFTEKYEQLKSEAAKLIEEINQQKAQS